MQYVMSGEACKSLDRYAIENLEIPSIVLMENAASEIVNKIKDKYDNFIIFCGNGNNGGDGLAIARKLILLNKNVTVAIIAEKEKYTRGFLVNYKILEKIKAEIIKIKAVEEFVKINPLKYDAAIDCIFGVGLNRELNYFYSKIVEFINSNFENIISVDVPSGINVDTGEVMGTAIKAKITYTFEVIKKGYISYSANDYIGNLELLNIGIPKEAKEVNSEDVFMLDSIDYKNILNKRKIYSHKGDFGKVSIIAGSEGYTGAAYIAAEACVRSGAGLTTLISSKYVQDILSCKLAEAMTLNIGQEDKVKKTLENSNVIAVGPGLTEASYCNIIKKIDSFNNKYYVIDAGALDIFSKDKELMNIIKNRGIFTPHPGEIAKLLDKTISYVEENRIEVAKKYAKENNIVVLLKGYKTVITDGNLVYINNTGNSKMASGGMGDCLTGIIASLLGQKHSLMNAALLGAYIHGLAGEEAGKNKYNVIASDIIDNISEVMENMLR
ncbi:NAD(P)H-hydrate dehydratase [Caproiciproducens sp. MSJ-32]|uniref:NAD(P)H-hydrate dehydratase n=1 Tax=Caproiciproducens sp. MSJ-32 TaxID=2841527 RepID=UPI001C11858B|nr:NAD(P)H-hydrate dehydratase [Caproiciproducens sp. MSJ-32]MBU5454669.1 NAD(P)H-hydrate dehydratase [Caproiciproducens sp. MSJ-32]